MEMLNEVVVVGYGIQKKVNLTGAVSAVDMKALTESRPVVNVSQALAGLAAGVAVTSTTLQFWCAAREPSILLPLL